VTTTPFMSQEPMTRRRILGAALAAGVAVPVGLARPAWAASTTPGPVQLTLPVPTGPYPVGTVSLHLSTVHVRILWPAPGITAS